MTIVVAYADTPPGTPPSRLRSPSPAGSPGSRWCSCPPSAARRLPTRATVEARWPGLAGRVEVERGDLGDPSDAVVQVAQRRDARLVVLGLRHRSPVGKIVFGSTAQRILLDATCPVLAVKPPPGTGD